MGNKIIGIFAEIRIEAETEAAALALASKQSIAPSRCRWRPHRTRPGGVLYVGGQIYVDGKHEQFSFRNPAE